MLVNPRVIIEVLSPSTEEFYRGQKRLLYQTVDSLTEYVLVAQDAPQVEHWLRRDRDQWLVSRVEGLDRHPVLASIDCHLALAEVYERVAFPASEG